ncbi:MAG: hypothetical protein F6K55_03300 [Moorea sp. SIO4A3]|nr:hypothetical protein [Moorena sp. SIO4A3]
MNKIPIVLCAIAGGFIAFATTPDKCPRFPVIRQFCAIASVPTIIATGVVKGGLLGVGLSLAIGVVIGDKKEEDNDGNFNPRWISLFATTGMAFNGLIAEPPPKIVRPPAPAVAKASVAKPVNYHKASGYKVRKGNKIVDRWHKEALRLYVEKKVDPTLFLAIASHESARGKKPIGSRNYWGVKYYGGSPRKIVTKTKEYGIKGCNPYCNLAFADWDTDNQAGDKIYEIMNRLGKGDPNNLSAISKGYATDPRWTKGVRRHQAEISKWIHK